ncbi:MAG: hypothetical protein HOP19_08295, partial [Acidobacteria bacterium]|nr:hypothetical protein [Acidobacteriota bacterium]
GNPRFTVAVQNALGGATATLVIDENDPGAMANPPASASFARTSLLLNGIGAGNGNGSVSLAIPDHASLMGKTLYGRWYVNDAGAPQGWAVSPAFKFTIFGTATNAAPAVASVSAASYAVGTVAAESIVAGFGANLSTTTLAANALPLPETLGGVTVTIKDVLGVERLAPLFFVSPGQINYQVPTGAAIGEGFITIKQNGNVVASGLLQIAPVAPGIFTVEGNGRGLPAATVLRVKADGAQSYEEVARFDTTTNRFEAVPIDFGPATDQLFLIVFGTGFRHRNASSAATATISDATAEVLFAGAQGSLIGVDQLNLRLPRTLAGRGNTDLATRVDGKTANAVTISFK